MANPNPSNQTRFRPGNRANPRGASAHDPTWKAMNLTKNELLGSLNLVARGSVADLKNVAQDPNAPAIHAMIASVVDRIIEKGDAHAFDLLLNRLVGKVKDEVHVDETSKPRVVLVLPDNGRSSSEAESDVTRVKPEELERFLDHVP